jgi:hypothetical protein
MITRQLHDVLDEIADTGEIVIAPPAQSGDDELAAAWRLAHSEASAALEEWRTLRTRDAFSVFRAAEDRADAAQDALAAR